MKYRASKPDTSVFSSENFARAAGSPALNENAHAMRVGQATSTATAPASPKRDAGYTCHDLRASPCMVIKIALAHLVASLPAE
jgi:hypothetical protein